MVALLLVFLTGLILAHFAHDSDRISEDRMQLLSRYGDGMRMLIGETLVNGRAESLPIMLKNLTPAGSSISSAVLDHDYRILFASRPADSVSTHLSNIVPAMPSADVEGRRSLRFDDQLHLLLHIDQPVLTTSFGESRDGWLYLHADLRSELAEHYAGLRPTLVVMLLLAVAVLPAIAWWLRKRIGAPLDALATVAATAAGDSPGVLDEGWTARIRRVAADVDVVESKLAGLRRRADADGRALRLLRQSWSRDLSDSNERVLVQGVCDRLVEEGFAAAWIAVTEEEESGLRFVARAGAAFLSEDSFDIRHLGLSDTKLLELENGRIVRLGLDRVAGGHAGWKDDAIRDGCVGMALVPLRRGATFAGIAVLLARQADLLDDVVLNSVQAMADSLAQMRKQASEARKHQYSSQEIERGRAMLRAVVDSIPDLIFFKDRASVYLGCNPAFEQLVSKPEIAIVGGTDFACFPEALARKFREDDARMLEEGKAIRLLEWVDFPDGQRRLLEARKAPYRDAAGQVLGLVGISRDITAQYLAQKELEAERALFMAGPTVVFRWSTENGWPIEYVSPNVLEQFGYEADTLIRDRLPYADLVHPEDLPRVSSEVTDYLADLSCTGFTQRYRLRRADGSYRSVSDQTAILRDSGSGRVDMRGYLIDISDVVDMQMRLHERIKELKGLYAVVRELSSTESDPDTALQAVAEALPPSFQFPELASARLRFRDRTYLAGDFAATRWLLHEELQLADGFPIAIDVAYSACPNAIDDVVFLEEESHLLQVIVLELARFSARREAEQQRSQAHIALRETNQRLQVVAQNSSDLLYQANAATGERQWLTNIGDALGFDRAAVEGAASRQWPGLIHPNDLAEYERALAALKAGSAYAVTYRVRVGDGSWRFMRDRGDWVESNGERIVVGACTDITDITLADEERARIAVHLRRVERMETLGMLTRGLTVDLNNKLQGISGFADIARRRLDRLDREQLANYLERIQTAAEQAAVALTGVTDFSDMGQRADARLDLAPVVEKAMALVRPSLAAGVAIKLHIDPGLPAVAAAPGDLLQVVVNLCLNAKQSLGKGGELNVSLVRVDDVNTHCSGCGQVIEGTWLELGVTDNGAPIPEEIRATMFDPTLDRVSYDRPGEFGMAAVHRIVMASGGHVVVDTVGERGNRVRVFLPPAAEAAPRMLGKSPVVEHQAIGAGLRAVVVDDDDQSGALLADQMTVFGFQAERFGSADTALGRLRDEARPVDLLMIDQNMPGMTGTAMCRALRADGKTFPIVVYSGFCDELSADNIGEHGANAFLAKPFGLRELDACIGRLFASDVDAR